MGGDRATGPGGRRDPGARLDDRRGDGEGPGDAGTRRRLRRPPHGRNAAARADHGVLRPLPQRAPSSRAVGHHRRAAGRGARRSDRICPRGAPIGGVVGELPIGEAVDVTPAGRPTRRTRTGRFVTLSPVDPNLHAGPLFEATRDAPDVWTYLGYGPFDDE